MKKIYKTIFILLLLIPFLVNSKDLNDLTHKWTETIEPGYYQQRPRPEKSITMSGLQQNILEDDKGYLMFTEEAIYRLDKQEKITKKISSSEEIMYIKKEDHILIFTFDNNDNLIIYKTDYQLNELNKLKIENSYYINFYERDNQYILLTEEIDSNDNSWLISYVLDKDINKKSSSSVFTYNSVYYGDFEDEYTDYYNNVYYTDENHVIHARNTDEDGNIFIVGDNKVDLYSSEGEFIKNVLKLTSDYQIFNTSSAVVGEYKYVAIREVYNDTSSTSANYKHRATIYKYDSNYNLVDSEQIVEDDTSSRYSYSLYTYVTNNSVYINYANTLYKISSSFSITPTTSSEINFMAEDYYNELEEPIIEELYYEVSNNIDYLRDEKYIKYEEELGTDADLYIECEYDVTEINDTIAILVTWIIGYRDETTSETKYKSETELIFLSGSNYETHTIFAEHDTEYAHKDNISHGFIFVHANQIIAAEGKLIISSSNYEERFIRIYNLYGTMEKELYKSEDDYYMSTHVSYENGHLLAVFSQPIQYPDSSPLSKLNDASKSKTEIFNKEDIAIVDIEAISGYFYYDDILASEIMYFETPFEVTTKTDGNGKVTATKVKADSGEVIEFTVTPEKGYVLGVVKVIDSNGNTITFTSNKFTMPSSDVVIDVTFVPDNPDTTTMGIFIISCLLIIGTGIILSIKNIKQINWLKN